MRMHATRDQDLQKGAIEGTKPSDRANGNANAPALDENGQPADRIAISEDVLGANVDRTEG